MKAILDHVGIAVSDLPAALAFYRDALGLEIEPPEEVAAQQVRAHVVPAGQSALELLEATGPESPIARYLANRGPGLHHITLRVDDIAAALERLRARGATLIDTAPRPGAGGALIAFIHPSSAHGVLVELKQAAAAERLPPTGSAGSAAAQRISFGHFELITLSDGFFRLDGGAMFGIVPKVLWQRRAPADERNRITLGLRPLVVRGDRTLLIDAGVGDKMDAKAAGLYGFDRDRHLDHAFAEAGLSPEAIDLVLATHLHFDHAGGFTCRDRDGRLRPRFPRAQYIVRRGEWEDAMSPSERTSGSYLAENVRPLAEAGVLRLIDDDQAIFPGVRVRRTGGHTPHHQMVTIESGGRTAAFVADVLPTAAHLPNAWIMGYDLYPLDTLAFKRQFLREAIDREYLIFLEHDPTVAAGYVREREGKRVFEPVR